MAKRNIVILLLLFIGSGSILAEYLWVPLLDYRGSFSEARFNQLAPQEIDGIRKLYPSVRRISKVSKDVIDVLNDELGRYDLDVGDVFAFVVLNDPTGGSGYAMALRITGTRGGGSTYSYYAWAFNNYSY
jgi:hypothetical protein